MNRVGRLTAFIFLLVSTSVSATGRDTASARPASRSATVARDIGGFALGMAIADAGKIAKLSSIGGGQFEAVREGTSYNMEVTPLGRIFRIQSSQPLGRFAVDQEFAATVLYRLTAKYGVPLSSDFGSYGWQLTEPVKHADGRVLPFTTMWMSAHINNGPGTSDVSLELKLIDFRLLWEDEAKVNRTPRDKAAQGIAL